MSLRKRVMKIGAASGILTPVLAFTSILIAIASYSEFSWINNALSDLGIIDGVIGSLFNFGVYSSGFFVLIFAVFGLFAYLGNMWIGRIGSVSFAATGLALMCIGFFPENVVPYHYLSSVAFFVLLPISLFIITGAFAVERQTKMALFTLLTAGATATSWILYFAFRFANGVAIPEFASAVWGSMWIVVFSYRIIEASAQ